MSLQLPYNIQVLNPYPLDYYYYNDDVPYTNVAEVNSAIPVALRYQGLTVNVASVEYWYKDGTADGDLVEKIAEVVTAHDSLTGLTTGDDHTQYALLAGRTGDTLNIDTISEYTTATGVTIDGVLIIDGGINWSYITDTPEVLVDGDFTSQGLMFRGATSGSYSILPGSGAITAVSVVLSDDSTLIPLSSAVYNAIAAINHDSLTGFVANEHIDWTGATQNIDTSGSISVDTIAEHTTDAGVTFSDNIIVPSIRITTGATDGYYLRSDASGNGTWAAVSASQVYKGTWDASTNTPTLIDGTGTAGWYYRVTVGDTIDLGSGNITFSVGDDVSYNGATWERIPAATITGNPLTDITNTGTEPNLRFTFSGSQSTALVNAAGIGLTWTSTLADSRIASASDWNEAYGWDDWSTNVPSATMTFTNKSGNISQWTNDSGYLDDGEFTSQGLMKRGATSGAYAIITGSSAITAVEGTLTNSAVNIPTSAAVYNAISAAGGMVYPGAGIAVSTSSAWDTSISIGVGTTTYLRNDGTWASETDPIFNTHTVSNITDGTGFLKNNGTGTWSWDNSTYLTEHPSITQASNVSINNSNGTVIQDVVLGFDSNGHTTSATFGPVDLDGRYYTETEVSNFFSGTTAISGYNKSTWDTHPGSTGASHTYINQNVTTTGSPTFAGLTVEGGATVEIDLRVEGELILPYILSATTDYVLYYDPTSDKVTYGAPSGAGTGDVTASTYTANDVAVWSSTAKQLQDTNGQFTWNGATSALYINGGVTLAGSREITGAPSTGGTMLNINGGNNDVNIWDVYNGTSGSFGFHLQYIGSGTGNANTLDLYTDGESGPEVLSRRVYQDGTTTFYQNVTAPNFVLSSDPRLKNVSDEKVKGIETIMQLKPVSFKWKDERDEFEHIGFLTTDVEEIRPELVSHGAEYDGISYSKITAINTAAIQDLKNEIEELKLEIKRLKDGSS